VIPASLEEAVELIPDGSTVAVGGAWLSGHPMALVRELVRQGRRDLHLVTVVGSVAIDALVGAGCAASVAFSFVSLEAFGLAPNFRRAAESGELELRERTGVGMTMGIEAASRGVPFLPYDGPEGTELAGRPDAYRSVECPFTGRRLTAVAAIPIDVAILHGARADTDGNVQLEGTHGPDLHMAEAASTVICTVEEVVSPEELRSRSRAPLVARHLVDRVVHAPLGAHPTSYLPYYVTDMWAIEEYVDGGAADVVAWAAEDEKRYRDRLDVDRVERLQALVHAVEAP